MCGIAGIVKTTTNSYSIETGLLRAMSDEIAHRGPDSDGHWIAHSGNAGFAFRRLAIIDLSERGNQPMQISNGRFTVVFNGEIYNHSELRCELERKGYKYTSNTDTETILYGYLEWGEALLRKMFGMWSFAIWDEEKQEFFAARDRIGIKPFYYLLQDGNLVFGSEIKSILKYKHYSPSINFDQLPVYFSLGSTSQSKTLFKSINKLPAAHYLHFRLGSTVSIKRYWDPFGSMVPYQSWSEEQLESELITLLRDSVKIRMMSDVPFGVFLSGGIDSSLNVALMYEFLDRPIDTFTVGYKDLLKYNELEYAHKIAALYRTNHREIIIDNEMALPVLEGLAWHLDEPNGDPVCIPIYFLSKLTRSEGTIVVLVGEGSDEQFIGYNWMLREILFNRNFWNSFNYMPQSLRQMVYYSLKPFLKAAGQYRVLDYFQKAAKNWKQYWSGQPFFTLLQQEELFSPDYRNFLCSVPEYASEINNQPDEFDLDIDFSQRIIYTEFVQRLPEMLLMRVDKMGMANSIEPRVPFLDHRIVEMSFALNFKSKIPDGRTTKYLLKKASEGIIPDEIIRRPKQGFAAPVTEWLRNEWYGYSRDKIFNSRSVRSGILSSKYIDNLMSQHRSGKADKSKEIYSLLSYALWEEKFIP